MFMKGFSWFLAHLFMIMLAAGSAWGAVPLKILPGTHWAAGLADMDRISRIVVDAFHLERDDSPYHRAAASVIYGGNGRARKIIVYLLHKQAYFYETCRINLSDTDSVDSVDHDYRVQPEERLQQSRSLTYDACPDPAVQMVFATCETEIPTALEAVDRAADIARQQGYSVRVLKGSEENVAAYEDWLACEGLVLFGRVGHGSPSAIMVDDGEVDSAFFNRLGPATLDGTVLYFNSCDVHNPPLEPAVLSAGTQKFIGGDVALLIGPSEEVFKCFLQRTIAEASAMTATLRNCEAEFYPETGAHGISGNGADFLSAPGGQDADPCNQQLSNGQVVTGLSGRKGEWCIFTLDVPPGTQHFMVAIQGGDGDADLYTRFNTDPTTRRYNCRPYVDGNDETCEKYRPRAGTWHIGLRAFHDYSDVTLMVDYGSWQEDAAVR